VALLPLGLGEGPSLLRLGVSIPLHYKERNNNENENNNDPNGDVLFLLFFSLLLLAILVEFLF